MKSEIVTKISTITICDGKMKEVDFTSEAK